MRFLLKSALKDLRWRCRDPAALLIWIGIPLLLGALFGALSGDGGSVPRPHLLLVDQDQSFASRLLVRASGAEQAQQALQIEEVATPEQGRARIEAGGASALLILPEGFGSAVLRDAPVTLHLITNPAQRILPRVVEEGLEILVEGAFYAQRLLGGPLRRIAEGPPDRGSAFPNETIAELSVQINERVRRLQGVLFPPVLALEIVADPSGDADTLGFAALFFPSMLLMSLVFVAQGVSDDVWAEKEQGVLRRVISTPQPLGLFLSARLVAGAVVMAAVSLAGLGIGMVLFDLSIARIPLALVWCTFVGTALLVFFTLLQLLGTSRRTASLLTMMVMFPLLMLGGSFFPFEAMPPWMVGIGRLTPNGQAVVQLKDILYREPDAGALGVAAVTIALPAIAAFVISARRLAGRFATS